MRPGVWRAHNQRQPLSWQGMNGRLISAAEAIDNQQRLSTLTGPHIQAGLPAPQNSNLQLLAPSDHMTWKQSQSPAIGGGHWRPPVVLAGPQRPASSCEFPKTHQASNWPDIIKIKKRKYLEGIYADFKSSSYFKRPQKWSIDLPSYGMNPWLVWFKGFWMKCLVSLWGSVLLLYITNTSPK